MRNRKIGIFIFYMETERKNKLYSIIAIPKLSPKNFRLSNMILLYSIQREVHNDLKNDK